MHRASLTFKAAFFLFMWKISSFSTFAAFLTCKSRKSPLPPAPKKTPPKNPNPLQAKINKLTFTPPLEATRVSFLLISFGGKRSLLTNDTSVGFYGSSNFCVIIYSLHCSASSRALLFFFFFPKFFFPFSRLHSGEPRRRSSPNGQLQDFENRRHFPEHPLETSPIPSTSLTLFCPRV